MTELEALKLLVACAPTGSNPKSELNLAVGMVEELIDRVEKGDPILLACDVLREHGVHLMWSVDEEVIYDELVEDWGDYGLPCPPSKEAIRSVVSHTASKFEVSGYEHDAFRAVVRAELKEYLEEELKEKMG